jgi:hypothetical protein
VLPRPISFIALWFLLPTGRPPGRLQGPRNTEIERRGHFHHFSLTPALVIEAQGSSESTRPHRAMAPVGSDRSALLLAVLSPLLPPNTEIRAREPRCCHSGPFPPLSLALALAIEAQSSSGSTRPHRAMAPVGSDCSMKPTATHTQQVNNAFCVSVFVGRAAVVLVRFYRANPGRLEE